MRSIHKSSPAGATPKEVARKPIFRGFLRLAPGKWGAGLRLIGLGALVIPFITIPSALSQAESAPPPLEECVEEPVRYVGSEQTDPKFYHGGLRHAVGVHRYQAFRANRETLPEGGVHSWTYNHQPYLAYWNNKFYLQYLSDLKEEHVPPGRTLVATSLDGFEWAEPRVAFPVYALPEIETEVGTLPAGTFAVMHQRMGFYIAPNGRLLTSAFYSYCPSPRHGPNNGQGLGRVVREIYKDDTFGPIYFIRYNRRMGWNESNTAYPFYKESEDAGFVEACEDLLADKLMTLQWWEEDRAKDGFYAIDPPEEIKALSYYHRPDGVVVGLWKDQLCALSPDEGKTWTKLVRAETLKVCHAKVWGQRTEDGKYALVYNHSATRRNRFPLVVMTGEDGHTFDNMLCLHGEVPPQRYQGLNKNLGPQYIRGIVEGNGDPPGNHLWNTYSMNKEDIWVTRTRVPVEGTVAEQVQQDFEEVKSLSDLEFWNLHIPQWAPAELAEDPLDPRNRCLRLVDEEPYDYALLERAFPESAKVSVAFRALMWKVGPAFLEIEVHDRAGNRPVRLRFDPDWLSMDRGPTDPRPVAIETQRWIDVSMDLDCGSQTYDLSVDGQQVRSQIEFAVDVETLERMAFRTGPWRGDVRSMIVDREPASPGLYTEDLPGADEKTPTSVFYIDDVRTEG
jgi:hypothetical protein